MSAGMVRINRGDGNLFQFRSGDVAAFLKANPGSFVVPGRGAPAEMTQREIDATAALEEAIEAEAEAVEEDAAPAVVEEAVTEPVAVPAAEAEPVTEPAPVVEEQGEPEEAPAKPKEKK